jgi:hypothetical protein
MQRRSIVTWHSGYARTCSNGVSMKYRHETYTECEGKISTHSVQALLQLVCSRVHNTGECNYRNRVLTLLRRNWVFEVKLPGHAPDNGQPRRRAWLREGYPGASQACESRHHRQRVHGGVAGEPEEDGRIGLHNADERRGIKTSFWRFDTESYQPVSGTFCKYLIYGRHERIRTADLYRVNKSGLKRNQRLRRSRWL